MRRVAGDFILFVLLSTLLAVGAWPILGKTISWSDDRGISFENAVKLGREAVWVDARKDKDFSRGHYPGAVNLNEHAWDAGVERFLNLWSPDKTVIIYCDSGGCRSGHHVAAHLERDLGVKAKVIVGGWSVVKSGAK